MYYLPHLFTLDGKVVQDGYAELVDRIKSIEDEETKNESNRTLSKYIKTRRLK